MNAGFWVFIVAFTIGLLLTPPASEAQQPAKIPRIGFLAPSPAPTPAAPHPGLQAFRQGLAGLGHVEGRDYIIEARFAESRVERLPELAAELVRLNVEVVTRYRPTINLKTAREIGVAIPPEVLKRADQVIQ